MNKQAESMTNFSAGIMQAVALQKTMLATEQVHFLLQLEQVMDVGVLKNNKARNLDSQLSN